MPDVQGPGRQGNKAVSRELPLSEAAQWKASDASGQCNGRKVEYPRFENGKPVLAAEVETGILQGKANLKELVEREINHHDFVARNVKDETRPVQEGDKHVYSTLNANLREEARDVRGRELEVAAAATQATRNLKPTGKKEKARSPDGESVLPQIRSVEFARQLQEQRGMLKKARKVHLPPPRQDGKPVWGRAQLSGGFEIGQREKQGQEELLDQEERLRLQKARQNSDFHLMRDIRASHIKPTGEDLSHINLMARSRADQYVLNFELEKHFYNRPGMEEWVRKVAELDLNLREMVLIETQVPSLTARLETEVAAIVNGNKPISGTKETALHQLACKPEELTEQFDRIHESLKKEYGSREEASAILEQEKQAIAEQQAECLEGALEFVQGGLQELRLECDSVPERLEVVRRQLSTLEARARECKQEIEAEGARRAAVCDQELAVLESKMAEASTISAGRVRRKKMKSLRDQKSVINSKLSEPYAQQETLAELHRQMAPLDEEKKKLDRQVRELPNQIGQLETRERLLKRVTTGFQTDEEVSLAEQLGASQGELADLVQERAQKEAEVSGAWRALYVAMGKRPGKKELLGGWKEILRSIRRDVRGVGQAVSNLLDSRREYRQLKKHMTQTVARVQQLSRTLNVDSSQLIVQIDGKGKVSLSDEVMGLKSVGYRHFLPTYFRRADTGVVNLKLGALGFDEERLVGEKLEQAKKDRLLNAQLAQWTDVDFDTDSLRESADFLEVGDSVESMASGYMGEEDEELLLGEEEEELLREELERAMEIERRIAQRVQQQQVAAVPDKDSHAPGGDGQRARAGFNPRAGVNGGMSASMVVDDSDSDDEFNQLSTTMVQRLQDDELFDAAVDEMVDMRLREEQEGGASPDGASASDDHN